MTRKELQTVREMTVVSVMDLLRRGRIDKGTTNQQVLNMLKDDLPDLPEYAKRLRWEDLGFIVSMKCVKCVYKDDRGRLIADIKRDASGLTYVAIEGDIIVALMEGDEQSEYGVVLPSEDINND